MRTTAPDKTPLPKAYVARGAVFDGDGMYGPETVGSIQGGSASDAPVEVPEVPMELPVEMPVEGDKLEQVCWPKFA